MGGFCDTIRAEDRHLTTFATPWGHYRFRLFPQAWDGGDGTTAARAASVWRCVSDAVGCSVHWDVTLEEHWWRTMGMLSAMADDGFVTDPDKFQFCQLWPVAPGLRLTGPHVLPPLDVLEVIESFQPLRRAGELASWARLLRRAAEFPVFCPISRVMAPFLSASEGILEDAGFEDAFRCCRSAVVAAARLPLSLRLQPGHSPAPALPSEGPIPAPRTYAQAAAGPAPAEGAWGLAPGAQGSWDAARRTGSLNLDGPEWSPEDQPRPQGRHRRPRGCRGRRSTVAGVALSTFKDRTERARSPTLGGCLTSDHRPSGGAWSAPVPPALGGSLASYGQPTGGDRGSIDSSGLGGCPCSRRDVDPQQVPDRQSDFRPESGPPEAVAPPRKLQCRESPTAVLWRAKGRPDHEQLASPWGAFAPYAVARADLGCAEIHAAGGGAFWSAG